MNKLTKVGCSALCGSLAAISAANAGDMTVTGGVDMSWQMLSGGNAGNPIGLGSNLTFKGSGELDNGWKFDLTVANANKNAYSASNVNLDMGGLGQLNIDHGDSGNGIAAFDDKMPTAWEEAWGNGLGTGVKLVVGSGASMSVMYTTPTFLGTTFTVTRAFEAGAENTADKSSTLAENNYDDGSWDLTNNVNPSFGTEALTGLNMYVGGHSKNAGNGAASDYYEGVAGMTFDIGPISLGAARTGHIMGTGVTATKVSHYTGLMYGVAFNVNDDLSVSYGYVESRKAGYVNGSVAMPAEANRRIEVESLQVAYSLGGASIRVAETKGENLYFSSTNDQDATTVSVSLAF